MNPRGYQNEQCVYIGMTMYLQRTGMSAYLDVDAFLRERLVVLVRIPLRRQIGIGVCFNIPACVVYARTLFSSRYSSAN